MSSPNIANQCLWAIYILQLLEIHEYCRKLGYNPVKINIWETGEHTFVQSLLEAWGDEEKAGPTRLLN